MALRIRTLAAAIACALVAGCGGSGGGGGSPAQRATPAPAEPITVVARRRLDPRLEQWTLRTPSLEAPTRVRVLLPARYRAEPRRRFPVLYLLHGAAADYRAWTRYGDAEAITAGAPVLVVMPDGGPDGWYTDWYIGDEPVQPRWETYHVGELIPWIDRTYRTIPKRRGRAIAGLSMGGFGALSYAARHPRVFRAAASFSGALEVGSTAAWGPRGSDNPRWREHLPISMAGRLKSLELVMLLTGDGTPTGLDPPGTRRDCDACALERFLLASNVRLHRRLRELGIAHVWDEGRGTHDWPYWRRDLRVALPALMRAFGGA